MLSSDQSAQHSSTPLVTMIILCYNQSRFVVETLESVKAQTYKHTELIIIDDCSADDSVAVIDRWLGENKIQCNFIRHQKNQGICKSLNEALAATSGKYVSMIASDDIWLPDKIERQVAIMESQPDSVGVLYSDAFRIDENGKQLSGMYINSYWKLSEMPQGQVLDTLLRFNFIPGPTTFIRRGCYDKVGLYDEELPWEDWDMWLRIARHYSFTYSPTPSAKYRIHEKSVTHSDPLRMSNEAFQVSLKQLALGDLTTNQKLKLRKTLSNLLNCLHAQNDTAESKLFSFTEQLRVVRWALDRCMRAEDFAIVCKAHAANWVPLVMSASVPFKGKWTILKNVRATDAHLLRSALPFVLTALRLKCLRYWRYVRALTA